MKKIIVIIAIIVVGSILGIGIYHDITHRQITKTPYDIQIAKVVTVQLANDSIVTLKGYALLDKDANFKKDSKVYVEFTDGIPSSLRQTSDVHEENGKMYADTECCGSYPAELHPGKVIATNY